MMTTTTTTIVSVFIYILLFSGVKPFDLETCRYPLGIESGKIRDSAFSSSSNAGLHAIASNARIRSETDGWCPLPKISSTTSEYLQIDLDNLTVITLIELQGKFSSLPNDQFADAFRLEYRRDYRQRWIQYKDFSGQHVLSGNTNSHIPTMRDILPTFVARQLRIIPIVTGPKPKHICLRLELYGCSYQDGPVAYSAPPGDKRGYDVQFTDETYDGSNDNGTLKDGLGQLTDGVLARDDYLLSENVQGIGQLGYDWIGWKRKPSPNFTISLQFYFDTIRQFNSISILASNLFTRDISLFSSVTITNCDDPTQRIEKTIPEDRTSIQARFVNISLGSVEEIRGTCLRTTFSFHPRSRWILLSEVLIDSRPIVTYHPRFTTPILTRHGPPSSENDVSIGQYWHWLLMASSLLVTLIVLLIFVYIQWIQASRRKQHIRKITSHLKFDSSYQPMSLKFPLKSRMNCCYVRTSDGSTASDEHSTCSTSNNDIRHHLIISTATSSTSPSGSRGTNGSDFGTLSTASPTTMSTVYQSVINPYLTAISDESPNVTSNPYASIDMYTSPMTLSEKIEPSIRPIQGPCGNSTLQSLFADHHLVTVPIPRINDEQLIVEERYSTMDGCFGTIVRGYIYLRHPHDTLKPILIKALTTDNITQKELFDEEHLVWARLSHPNLVQFFGCTVKQNYALFEHSSLGDLYTYLLSTSCLQPDQALLSMNVRLLIITQLTNALRYLESEKIVHRDIAARNCLIYPNYEIKLTNTALAAQEFQSHYLTLDCHRRLPIRWMAPETLTHDEFSSQSDIWSFGITLWEVMTNCFTLPYALLTDDQVYQRLKLMGTSLVRSSGTLQLSKPEYLSKELVDLMLECWRPFGERPTFHEIFTFFNKRLNGITSG